jgi:hypothetical protein
VRCLENKVLPFLYLIGEMPVMTSRLARLPECFYGHPPAVIKGDMRFKKRVDWLAVRRFQQVAVK